MVTTGVRSRIAGAAAIGGLVIVLAGCGSSASGSAPETSAGRSGSPTATTGADPVAYYGRCYTPADPELGTEASPLQVRPSEVELGCEGSSLMHHVTWSTWSAASAAGSGTLDESDCDPSCAEGKRTDYPVTVLLDRPRDTGCGTFFSRVRVTYTGATPPPDRWEDIAGDPPTVTLDGLPGPDQCRTTRPTPKVTADSY